jgi:hypothetical protein
MKKKKNFFPVVAFIIVSFVSCANGGNAPGPKDSTDNSLPVRVDRDSLRNSFTDSLHDTKDTMHP